MVGADPLVELRQLSVTYRSRQADILAVDGFNCDVGDREFVSIIGPSGCGKSTTLKAIAGLRTTTGGSVSVAGQLVTAPPADIGMMFQTPVLLDWLLVVDNVGLPLEIGGMPKTRARELALQLLARAGLGEFALHRPFELSGGMQQRVALCRALVIRPRLLLMDEPFGALDAITRDQMGLVLQRLWLEYPVAVVFVTHDIAEAVLLSDRVLVMSQRPGRLVGDFTIDLGRPRSLRDRGEPAFQRHLREVTDALAATGALEEV